MSYKKYYYMIPLLCLMSLHVNAEEYKTGNMTQEEFQKVREATAEHSECVNEFSISQLEIQNDPRVIADHAMKECAPILENLYEFLLTGNYAPEPMRRFVSSISNKAANKILPKLMMFMAQKNSG